MNTTVQKVVEYVFDSIFSPAESKAPDNEREVIVRFAADIAAKGTMTASGKEDFLLYSIC